MIEQAQKTDLPEILRLQKLSFQSVAAAVGNYNLAPLTQTLVSIEAEFTSSLFLKKTDNGMITGSVRARLDDQGVCHIGRLIVHPDYQRRGFGRALMLEIETRIQPNDCFEIFTGSSFTDTIRLYKQLGYAETIKKDMEHVSMQFMRKSSRWRQMEGSL
ncbi:hypothetical protein PSTEL_23320 [Paenibacillus stellifer]|uniref:N-acetyltransferase domain-containing protein n=1 Tax=Paenibacillus stellifer TaxID=169760 RepID=A0A089LXF3_9BACL|nr:GNAT family N-acetyltransferase [Paenibacillus stellifer]AIQ65602.1 hypothetical protein PSTEL_23320 [Paenibacillus stellifer]